MWTKEFQCGGHESALLDCRSSGSERNTCSPGKAVGLTCSEPVRLVGGASRCAGTLEAKPYGDWRPVDYSSWTLKKAADVCRDLDCGSALSMRHRQESSTRSKWLIAIDCLVSGSALRDCSTSQFSSFIVDLTCSHSVRLLNGTSLCSGRLEVRSPQTNQSTQSTQFDHSNQSTQWWSSVCEEDFGQQDAEVVCRELGCGAPSVLQGALYGEGEAPMWTKEFQCGGHESALLDCRSSGSERNTCSPGKAVGLTCSEPVRLVGGASRCAGTVEVKHHGEWRPVYYSNGSPKAYSYWTLKDAAVVCRDLDCGSAVSIRERTESSKRFVWMVDYYCVLSALRDCVTSESSSSILDLTCSGKPISDIIYDSSVSSMLLPLSDSQVSIGLNCNPGEDILKRDLLLQPIISVSSSTDGVSETRQQGLQVPRGSTFTICCSIQPQYPGGSFQLTFNSFNTAHDSTQPAVNHSAYFLFPAAEPAHQGSYSCVYHVSVFSHSFSSESRLLSLTVQDSVRLVDGNNLCSGRLEVRSNQSTQSTLWWSSVCEEDFDQQDAEVVCRELGCGAPSVLQGALYGDVEAPMWTKEFQCGGHESALLDCRSSGSERNTCSPGKAVGLTCSEPVRMVGGASRCAGTLEAKPLGDWRPRDDFYWRPVGGSGWTLEEAAVACRDLDCGSAVYMRRRVESSERSKWRIDPLCVQSGSALRDCLSSCSSSSILDLTCSDLLLQPNISVSSSTDGVCEAQQQGLQVPRGSTFTICCSIKPQYPGGSFQLTFSSSNTAHNSTQPAVNHSAYFLFPAAEPAHQGSYSCVYHVSVFSHNFFSESHLLSLTVQDPTPLIIRAVVMPLTLLLVNTALYYYCKATRGQKPDRREDIALDYYNLGVPAAEGAQGAEERLQSDGFTPLVDV